MAMEVWRNLSSVNSLSTNWTS